MTPHCLSGGVYVAVLDTKILAGLLHDWRDARVMRLDDAWEEVVCDLMVEGTSEHCPEPIPCGVILSCGNLQLGPKELNRVWSALHMCGDLPTGQTSLYVKIKAE